MKSIITSTGEQRQFTSKQQNAEDLITLQQQHFQTTNMQLTYLTALLAALATGAMALPSPVAAPEAAPEAVTEAEADVRCFLYHSPILH